MASFDPAALLVLDHDETHLHDLLATAAIGRATSILADIRDRARMQEVLTECRPEVVFHAAAHKHVPILEDHPQEAFATNVLGTANLAEAAVATGTAHFVLISTDKAVHPSSVMGASKRLAEQVVRQRAGPRHDVLLRAVRQRPRQPGSRRPHVHAADRSGWARDGDRPEMTRYFMSIPEAVQLVLQAVVDGEGRRSLHAGDGRARQDRRSCQPDDPPVRTRAGSRRPGGGRGRETGREAA